MIKFLPIGVLILLIIFFGGYLLVKRSQTQPTSATKQLSAISGQTNADSFAPVSSDDRIKILEDAVIVLAKKVNGDSTATNVTAGLETRIGSLEDKVTALQRQISQSQPGVTFAPTPTGTASVKHTPVYIPLGWVASSAVMDWTTISSQSVVIDTNEYLGLTGAQFEARIVNYQGNGTAYARLINTTDGTAIAGSQVSVSATDYTWVASSVFSLSVGKKTYAVQLKTDTGYAAQISDAHLKINF